jgi:hypothetical protein
VTGYAIPIGGGTTWTARQDRQSRSALLAPSASGLQATGGVRPGPGLDVSVAGSTITVTAGSAIVQSAASVLAGAYEAWLDASWTQALTAADGTNPRNDLVYLRVRDTDEDGSGARDCTPVYVVGTASASPVTPSIPGGTSGIVLGVITVPKSGAGSPTVSYATRRYAVTAGGAAPVPSGLLATAGVYIGQTRFNLSRNVIETWNGTVWAAPGDWQDYACTWGATTIAPAVSTGSLTARYSLVGYTCNVKIELATSGGTTYGNGTYTWSVPFVSSAAGSAVAVGSAHGITSGARWLLQTLVTSTQQVLQVLTPAASGDNRLAFLGSGQGMGGVAWTSGQTLRAAITYEIAP